MEEILYQLVVFIPFFEKINFQHVSFGISLTIHRSKILRDAEGVDLQLPLELLLYACQPPQQPGTESLVVTQGRAIEYPDAQKTRIYGPIEKKQTENQKKIKIRESIHE